MTHLKLGSRKVSIRCIDGQWLVIETYTVNDVCGKFATQEEAKTYAKEIRKSPPRILSLSSRKP